MKNEEQVKRWRQLMDKKGRKKKELKSTVNSRLKKKANFFFNLLCLFGSLVMRIYSLSFGEYFVCLLRREKLWVSGLRIRANKKIKVENPEQSGND